MSILPKEISATIYTFLFQESHHCTNQALTCHPADQRFSYIISGQCLRHNSAPPLSVSRTLLRVDGKHKHQCIQCIVRIPHIDHIGIRHVEQLLADRRYQI